MFDRTLTRRWSRWTAAPLAALLVLSACSDKKDATPTTPLPTLVTVASVDTPERQALSEIYALGLEQAGYRVARLDGVADAAAGYRTVSSGEASVVIDYSDELLTLVRAETNNSAAIPDSVTDQVAALGVELPETLAVTAVSPAVHQPGLACTATAISEELLSDVSSLAAAVDVTIGIDAASAGELTEEVLRTTLDAEFPIEALADTAAARAAILDGTVQCLAIDSADPLINELQLSVLVDDRPMVRDHAIQPLVNAALPADVRAAINDLSLAITTTGFGQLLSAVNAGTAPHVAARAFLQTLGALG